MFNVNFSYILHKLFTIYLRTITQKKLIGIFTKRGIQQCNHYFEITVFYIIEFDILSNLKQMNGDLNIKPCIMHPERLP